MKSLWNDADAADLSADDLAMRVYSSRLLGSSADLVMHGGGNTSVKGTAQDFFGNEVEVLYVKGSGWDLKTIEKPGFPAIRLHETRQLAELDELSDTDMTQQLRVQMQQQSMETLHAKHYTELEGDAANLDDSDLNDDNWCEDDYDVEVVYVE